jgi:hypothetical protein
LFLCVTTFNRAGLDLYGRRMMDSFLEHWPDHIPLLAYSEGWSTKAGGQIEVRDLLESSPWLGDFKERNAHRSTVDYRMDAVRFSHKVAALAHAISLARADIVIWLDGDIVTHSPIGVSDLISLMPGRADWISWLDRRGMHPECGFYMINTAHARHAEIFGEFESMYRDNRLFSLKEWHDSYVLQQVVARTGAPAKSLSGRWQKVGHPLINGPLGQWFDHLKGNRKEHGRSRPNDLFAMRQEPYWKGLKR